MRRASNFLVDIEIIPVAAIVGLSVVSSRFLPAAIGVGLVFWLLRLAARGNFGQRSALDWGVLLLVAMLPVSYLVSTERQETAIQAARLLSGVVLFYAMVNWANSLSRLRWLVVGMIILGDFLAVFSAFSVAWVTTKLPFVPAGLYQSFALLAGDTVNPNVMAGFLVVLLPLPLAFTAFGWKRGDWLVRLLMAAAVLPMLAVLLLTQSRGALLAMAVSVLALLMLRWRWLWVGVVLAAGVGLVVWYQTPWLEALLQGLLASPALAGGAGRVEVWWRAVYIIQDFPFTGVGMGGFTRVVDIFYPMFSYEPGKVTHAHNLFLQIAVDLGIPGLLGWLGCFFLLCFGSYRVWRAGRGGPDEAGWTAALGAGLCSALLAMAVHGMTDAVIWGQVRAAPVIWGAWGLAAALNNLQADRLQHPATLFFEKISKIQGSNEK